jgi:uncharacterized membrane protein
VRLDGDRTGTLCFDRDGRARLSVALDHPATVGDLDALERAADALPYLTVVDLPDGASLPRRHAEAFELPAPLPPAAFAQAAEVELLARPGGVRLPRHLGRFGVACHLVVVPPPAPPRPGGGPGGRSLLDLARWPVAATRRPAYVLCGGALAACLAAFVVAFTWQTWTLHDRFGSYGFDLGIFDQGTWLLSRAQDPFVTIRGLNLFADHASLVLVLVAPLYRLWSSARLLLALQVLGLAAPVVAVYRLGVRRLGSHLAGLAVAVAYLAYPGMQWAITWQFHPETIAAAGLAFAALAADRRRWRAMAAWLALALSCKEDVGLVVAGFGLFLVVRGERRVGWYTAAAGAAWFALATFVLIPLVSGRASPHFELNYGIPASSPRQVLLALPQLVRNATLFAFTDNGIAYLALVFLPLLGLPLLGAAWLLPVVAPLFLNLAAVHTYQHSINYQYLATSAPFLAFAAVAGAAALAARRRALLAPVLVALVLTAGWFDHRYGPALWSRAPVYVAASPHDQVRRRALALVDPDRPVSATYNLVTHLDHRRAVYEFPNPYRAENWGLDGDAHTPQEVAQLHWVVVEPALLGDQARQLLAQLRASPEWRTRFDEDGVVVLERAGAGP